MKKKNYCMVIDDEMYCKCAFLKLSGPQYYSTDNKENALHLDKVIKIKKLRKKALIWQAICGCGMKSRSYITNGTMNSNIYKEECLKKRLLPFIRTHDGPPLFWPDFITSQYILDIITFIEGEGISFIPKEVNPPNVPQLRPIERF